MIELKELRGLTPEELLVKEQTLKKEMFNLRFQLATGRIESTAQIGQVKRDIARIKTVYREKQFPSDLSNPKEANPVE